MNDQSHAHHDGRRVEDFRFITGAARGTNSGGLLLDRGLVLTRSASEFSAVGGSLAR
jgi:hypothetical protein